MMDREYCIYDHISPSGGHYIGQTCRKAELRWGKDGSGYLVKNKDGEYIHKPFANAINKYGWDNFEHKILATGLCKEEADLLETEMISIARATGKCYNVTCGGEGCLLYNTDEERIEAKREVERRRNQKPERKEYNKRKSRKWKQEHREEHNAANRLYFQENREEVNAKHRDYYQENKEEINAKHKQYYQEHKEEILARQRAKRQANKENNGK